MYTYLPLCSHSNAAPLRTQLSVSLVATTAGRSYGAVAREFSPADSHTEFVALGV